QLETGFGFYMLIPLALAAMILLLEFNLERGRRLQTVISMIAPVLLTLLAVMPSTGAGSEIYRRFLSGAVGADGSPMLPAFAGTLLFYLYAWSRRVKYSDIIVCAVLFLAMPLNMHYHFLPQNLLPGWIPGVAGLAMLSWVAVRSNSTVSWMVLSLGALTVGGTIFRGTAFTAWHCAIPFHLALLTAMLLGLLRHDRMAVILKYVSTVALTLLLAATMFAGNKLMHGLPGYFPSSYFVVIFAASTLYCLYSRNTFFCVVIGFNVAALLLFALFKGYDVVQAMNLRGSNIIFWGLACFAAAFIISAFKGKLIQKAFAGLKTRNVAKS
ncbi:MAG: hypothetical protein ACYC4Q_03685, partial [Victivallaceae bacterium]